LGVGRKVHVRKKKLITNNRERIYRKQLNPVKHLEGKKNVRTFRSKNNNEGGRKKKDGKARMRACRERGGGDGGCGQFWEEHRDQMSEKRKKDKHQWQERVRRDKRADMEEKKGLPMQVKCSEVPRIKKVLCHPQSWRRTEMLEMGG